MVRGVGVRARSAHGEDVRTPAELAHAAVEHGAVQKESELRWFVGFLRHHFSQRMGRVLEIGCKDGGTLWLWRQLADEVVGVDVNPVPVAYQGVQVIQADSHKVVVDGLFDMVFIDGDHSYDGVLADWDRFSKLTRLVALHDIVPGTDGRAVDALWAILRASYDTREWVDPASFPVRGETLGIEDGGIGAVLL